MFIYIYIHTYTFFFYIMSINSLHFYEVPAGPAGALSFRLTQPVLGPSPNSTSKQRRSPFSSSLAVEFHLFRTDHLIPKYRGVQKWGHPQIIHFTRIFHDHRK